MRTRSLVIFLVILTLLSGFIWLVFNIAELEPVTIILGGIAALLEALEITNVNRRLAILIAVIGIGCFIFGITRTLDIPPLPPTPTATIPSPTSTKTVTPRPSATHFNPPSRTPTRTVPTKTPTRIMQPSRTPTKHSTPVSVPTFHIGAISTLEFEWLNSGWSISVFCFNCGSYDGPYRVYRSEKELDLDSQEWEEVREITVSEDTSLSRSFIASQGVWYKVEPINTPENMIIIKDYFLCCGN